MPCLRRCLILACCLVLPLLTRAEDAPLQVGIREAPPFVMAVEGGYSGISIELWELIRQELELDATYQTTDLKGLLDGVADGRYDVGVAAITVTEAREAVLDFTHPFFTTGLGIATRRDGGLGKQIIATLLNRAFLAAVASLGLLLMIIGAAVWLVERRTNTEHFGGRGLRGLADGFWWSAVTMTTVGYGDKAPRTLCGRLIGIVWMFASIFLITGFTAAVASSLTATRISTAVDQPGDIHRVTVGVIAHATSHEYASQTGLTARAYDSLQAAFEALERREIDAVIHDRPLLRWLARDRKAVVVLPHLLRNEDYAFALPRGSGMRKDINRALLQIMESGAHRRIIERYLDDIGS